MRLPVNVVTAVATAAAFIAMASLPASADCKRYGFSVNDYGKDGPTKDAKDLLDKTIASKMAEKGVKDYRTGKKSVSCELFLNFVLFDEHTCTAEATVCWGGSQLPSSEQAAATDGAAEPAKATAEEATTPKSAKKKKKETAGVAEHHPAAEGPASAPPVATLAAVPDPKKPEPEHAAEEKPAFVAPAATDTATDSTAPAPADASTTATVEPSPAAKPVETGSLSEKKLAKHKTESTDGADGAVVAPIKSKSSESGYPTPLPPGDQPSP